jgi:ABC-2 type transport system ATP-binding protein
VSTSTNTPIIQTENLTKRFKSLRKPPFFAVDGINLTVNAGQVYGFLGPNGAGKSTTIRLLLNLMRPTDGQVLVFGEDPRKNPLVLRKVGALIEGATFYPYLSAWDNLKVIGLAHGVQNEAEMTSLLNFVGLSGKEKVRVGKFSTGMKQRLGIAATLLHNPELVILDEPTNGMDPMGIREMRTFIRDLAHKHGKTVFVTSHLLDEIQQMADYVSIIHQGKIQTQGTIESLLKSDPWVQIEVSSVDAAISTFKDLTTERLDGQKMRVKATREQIPDLVRRLVGQGVDIFAINEYQVSLEEFFFEVIGATQSGGKLQ